MKFKKLFGCCALLLSALLLTPTIASADAAVGGAHNYQTAGYYVVVNAWDGYVNFRYGPGMEYGINTPIYNGVVLYVESTADNYYDGLHWGQVSYNGDYGWISLSEVSYYEPATQQSEQPQTTAAQVDGQFAIGSKGTDVKKLQEKLIALGFLKGMPDGDFGAMTEAAVKEFQKDHKLTESGIVDDTLLELIKNEAEEVENEFLEVLTGRYWLWMYQIPHVIQFYKDGTFRIFNYLPSEYTQDYMQQDEDGNLSYKPDWQPDPEVFNETTDTIPYKLSGSIVTLEFSTSPVELDCSGIAGDKMQEYNEVQKYNGDCILFEYNFIKSDEPNSYPYILLAVGEIPESEKEVPLVSDRYRYNYSEGEFKRSCAIPQINLGSSEVAELNEHFYSMYTEIETLINNRAQNIYIPESLIETTYEWYQNDDVLSVVLCHRYGGPLTKYEVYNLSISEQRLLSNEEVLAAAGYTPADYLAKAAEVFEAAFLTWDSNNNENAASYKERTLSEDNIMTSMPYINGEGRLCTIGMIYVYGVQVSDQWMKLEF